MRQQLKINYLRFLIFIKFYKFQSYVSVINNMQTITPRKRNGFTDRIRNNIHEVVTLLHADENQIVTISSSSSLNVNQRQQKQFQALLPKIRKFIQNMFNPYQCLPLMTEILNKNIIMQDSQPLFEYTIFHNKLKPALTLYLYSQTPFLYMRENTHKIIDVFYKFLLFQENNMIQHELHASNKNNSIGEWLKQEGLYKIFHSYYSDPKSFTIFVGNFMCFGLSYMFISAVAIMKGYLKVIKKQEVDLQRLQLIEIGYIKKYKLADKQYFKFS